MRVWRICRKPHALNTLAGLGGLATSGRWHSKGRSILYTASSAALAALETLVHVDPLLAPVDLQLLTIEIPDDLPSETLDLSLLPKGWAGVPAPAVLQAMGDDWLQSQRSAVWIVPSAVIPMERNLLLNPQHPEAHRLRLIRTDAFSFDPRLL